MMRVLRAETRARYDLVVVPRKLRVARAPTRARRGSGGVVERPGEGLVSGQETNITFEPFCRVVLEYTLWNDNRAIAEKIVIAIPGIGRDNADRAARIARAYGSSILLTTTRDLAIEYVKRLGTLGIRAHTEEA